MYFYLQKSDEEKLAAEIERVMKEGRRELEKEQERVQNLIAEEKINAKQNENVVKTSVTAVEPMKIKVRWKASTEWNESKSTLYDSASLKTIFSKYGDVNIIVISEASTARKGKLSILYHFV